MLKLNKKSKSLPSCPAADSLPCPWLPTDLHSDASRAVVQSLGRFMASYFTNQPLYILPAHNVAVLPPLHLPHGVFIKLALRLKGLFFWEYCFMVLCVSFLSSLYWAFGATVPGGGGSSSSTATSVRGMDGGLCPGPAPAGGAASWGCVVGISSGRLEDSRISEPGIYQLLHWTSRLHSVGLNPQSKQIVDCGVVVVCFYCCHLNTLNPVPLFCKYKHCIVVSFFWQAQEERAPPANSFRTWKHF